MSEKPNKEKQKKQNNSISGNWGWQEREANSIWIKILLSTIIAFFVTLGYQLEKINQTVEPAEELKLIEKEQVLEQKKLQEEISKLEQETTELLAFAANLQQNVDRTLERLKELRKEHKSLEEELKKIIPEVSFDKDLQELHLTQLSRFLLDPVKVRRAQEILGKIQTVKEKNAKQISTFNRLMVELGEKTEETLKLREKIKNLEKRKANIPKKRFEKLVLTLAKAYGEAKEEINKVINKVNKVYQEIYLYQEESSKRELLPLKRQK